MTLNLHAAASIDDLIDQCDPATTQRLAHLMLRTFAVLGAAPAWGFLPGLAEDLARAGNLLGLPVGEPSAADFIHWQEIAEEITLPDPVAAKQSDPDRLLDEIAHLLDDLRAQPPEDWPNDACFSVALGIPLATTDEPPTDPSTAPGSTQ